MRLDKILIEVEGGTRLWLRFVFNDVELGAKMVGYHAGNFSAEKVTADITRIAKEVDEVPEVDAELIEETAKIVFADGYKTRAEVHPDREVYMKKLNSKDKSCIFPTDDFNAAKDSCECMQNLCSALHTPKAKADYKAKLKAERGPVQKTIKVMKPYSRVEMIDGKAVMKTGEEEVDEPVYTEIPVVDEAGNPVVDEEGVQLTHKVPVMEE